MNPALSADDSPICHECGETPDEPVLAGHRAYCPEHAPLRRANFVLRGRCMACHVDAPTYRSECLPCYEDRTDVEVLP